MKDIGYVWGPAGGTARDEGCGAWGEEGRKASERRRHLSWARERRGALQLQWTGASTHTGVTRAAASSLSRFHLCPLPPAPPPSASKSTSTEQIIGAQNTQGEMKGTQKSPGSEIREGPNSLERSWRISVKCGGQGEQGTGRTSPKWCTCRTDKLKKPPKGWVCISP